MLVAREQLNLVKVLVAKIGVRSSTAKSVAEVQSQQVAIIALLRSVGHVLAKVDCDSPERRAWCDKRWQMWRKEPIFSSFIDFNRNRLLKEFKGLSALGAPELDGAAVAVEPSLPGRVDMQTWLDPQKWLTADGEPMMAKLKEAIAFWDRCLGEAEAAFGKARS